jgi:hypothetical protein
MGGTEFSAGRFYTRSKKLHGAATISLIVIGATREPWKTHRFGR